MSLAILELVQKDNGDIVLQEDGGGEPLLQLRFSRNLTKILGADALTLAQAMVESASSTFEYAQETTDPADGALVRLQTSPLH